MGHTRLGTLPKTRLWKTVAAMYANAGSDGAGTDASRTDFGHEVERLADAALAASAAALERAKRDTGIAEALFLLTQVALAARRQDPSEALWELGVTLETHPSPVLLVSEVNRLLDEATFASGRPSDVGEMAQAALSETLATWFRRSPADMFASPGEQFWGAMQALGTQKSFGTVTQEFFGNLLGRLLGFHLTREASPGDGQKLISDAADLSRFRDELRRHAHERARIVRDFAGGWFSKREFEAGIDRASARRFVAHALRKIADEFKRGAATE